MMATYEITAPDGKTYRVTGEGSKEDALAAVKRQVAGIKTVDKYGSVLPIERYKGGGWDWNFNAGLPGSIWRGVSAPGEALRGEIAPEDMQSRAMETAALMTPMTPGMRSGVGIMGAPITKRAKVKPPTAKELFGEGGKQFDALRETGVEYSVDAVTNWADNILYKLDDAGFDLDGATARKVRELLTPPEGAVSSPIKALAKLRRRLTKIGQNPGEEREASRIVRESLDSFIAGPPQNGVVAGRASDAGALLKEANANWAAGKRTGDIEKIVGSKTRRAAAANSGQNIGNSLRQGTSSLLDSERRSRGFSDAEKAALEKVARGTFLRNRMRGTANFLGGGGGWGSASTSAMGGTAGYLMGGPYGAAAGAMAPIVAGKGLKAAENTLSRRALEKAGELTAQRSPLYNKMQATAPAQTQMSTALTAAQRATLITELLRQKKALQAEKGNAETVKEIDAEVKRLINLVIPPNQT